MLRKSWLIPVLLASTGCAEREPLATDSPLLVDVSAVTAGDFVRPVNGVSASGQPDADALQGFANSGYSAVIDLRGQDENRGLDESRIVEELGMSYIPLPIAGSDAISFENARLLKSLIDEQQGPVLVHCASGNRVGALLALIESLDGADDAAALEAGKNGGLTGLEATVRKRLAEKPSQH